MRLIVLDLGIPYPVVTLGSSMCWDLSFKNQLKLLLIKRYYQSPYPMESIPRMKAREI